MIKIYYNNKPLILTGDVQEYIDAHPVATDYVSYQGASVWNYRKALQQLDDDEINGAIIADRAEALQLEQIYKLYEPIQAGGGVVLNEDGHVLMIYRRGKWDLPKGKLDEGEDIDTCAMREVSEETGLLQLQLEGKVTDTYHIYSQQGQHLLKHTAWYRMRGTAREPLLPQKEENIMEACWIPVPELDDYARKSFEAIREVLQAAGLVR